MSSDCRFVVLGLLFVLAFRAAGAGAQPPPDSTAAVYGGFTETELRAGPAWKPAAVVREERPWETAVRAPVRVATFPFALLSLGLNSTLRWVEASDLIAKVNDYLFAFSNSGFAVVPASLGDRTGLGLSARFRPHWTREFLLAEVSGSTKGYNRSRLELFQGPARLGYRYEWRPSDRFFGAGAATTDERSSYAARTQALQLSLDYPWKKDARPPFRAGAWIGPREITLREGREEPSFDALYPGFASQRDHGQEHLVYGVRVGRDTRAGLPHWSSGWRLGAAVERFDRAIDGLVIRDPGTHAPTYTRTTLEGETGWSFFQDPRTLRASVRVQDLASGAPTSAILILDLASLGGHEGLAGFQPGRFHDRDLVLGKLTYVFPVANNFELDLHAETGNVFARLERLRPAVFEQSYGVTLRPRIETRMLGALGLDWCREGARIRFSLGGVE